jgi:hypothetical protein
VGEDDARAGKYTFFWLTVRARPAILNALVGNGALQRLPILRLLGSDAPPHGARDWDRNLRTAALSNRIHRQRYFCDLDVTAPSSSRVDDLGLSAVGRHAHGGIRPRAD